MVALVLWPLAYGTVAAALGTLAAPRGRGSRAFSPSLPLPPRAVGYRAACVAAVGDGWAALWLFVSDVVKDRYPPGASACVIGAAEPAIDGHYCICL